MFGIDWEQSRLSASDLGFLYPSSFRMDSTKTMAEMAVGDAMEVPLNFPQRPPGSVLIRSSPGANAKTRFEPKLLERLLDPFACTEPMFITLGKDLGGSGKVSRFKLLLPALEIIRLPFF